eukprot:6202669-Pleurochrysis_carterae.AAC.3
MNDLRDRCEYQQFKLPSLPKAGCAYSNGYHRSSFSSRVHVQAQPVCMPTKLARDANLQANCLRDIRASLHCLRQCAT